MATRGGAAKGRGAPLSGAAAAAAVRGKGIVRGGRRPIQTIKLKTLRRPQASDIIQVFNQRTESLSDKKSLAEDFGLVPLIELSNHEHISIKGYGEKMLYALKHDEGEIYVEDFSPIAEVLRFKNMQAQRDGIWTLAIFAGLSDKNHPGILLDVGWTAILTRAKASHPQLRLGAVTLIANLSSSEDSQEIIMKEGGYELLKELLYTPDLAPELRRAVFNAFANLTGNPDLRSQIVDSKFLDTVVNALSSEDEDLVGAACNILANLSENPERRRELVQRGLIDTMLPLLRSGNEVILQGATKFFAQMCENQEYAEEAVEKGLLGYLARLAQRCDNPQVQQNVIRCADVLADLGFGDAIRGVDLDKFLRRLMENTEDEDVRQAAMAFFETLDGTPANAKYNKSQEEARLRQEAEEARRLEQEAIAREEAERERIRVEREAKEALERQQALERAQKVQMPERKKPQIDREALIRAEAEALARAKMEQEARAQGKFLGKKL
eukprot:TRINITY_DN14855_c0_g1_i2.p1 TRINITY_DN14855_c0_g1~~TRINITY_DN14855_c0_g1_i2.p1  ORF type:complete len:497 (+),score=160.73 TRINITY_DN14855_c0_g1_i2:107-1597(+)